LVTDIFMSAKFLSYETCRLLRTGVINAQILVEISSLRFEAFILCRLAPRPKLDDDCNTSYQF